MSQPRHFLFDANAFFEAKRPRNDKLTSRVTSITLPWSVEAQRAEVGEGCWGGSEALPPCKST